jgi:hypothetical protein
MPDELIWSYRADQGLRAVEKLARDAKVSLEAAAIRLVAESRKPAVLIVLEPVGSELRVRYSIAQGVPAFVPRGAPADESSVFTRAFRTGQRARGVARLPGRSSRELHVEAKAFPRSGEAARDRRILAMGLPAIER